MKNLRPVLVFVAAIVGVCFATDAVKAAPYGSTLYVSQASIMATVDTQTATVAVDTDTPDLLDEVCIIVNYPVAGQPNNARGYFRWSRTGGFEKLGFDN